MKQQKTPLYDEIVLHKKRKPISFHVPGHKNGQIFPKEAEASYKELLKLDVTELTGLDDLHDPEGVIKNSEQLLAELYGVQSSSFLVNGSTVGNLAMIMASINDADTVLVQRNCHKSIQNGLQLVNANPVFLNPEYDQEWKVAGGLSYQTVQSAIEAYPAAKALIVTYPNYYGMVYDLERIITLAHQHGIAVLVDEAHGAHFIAGTIFPKSAVDLGADIVVQSAHKTLPAMTMGSFLHFNSELISVDVLNNYLHILQSSSPSYPIMASLDLARSYLGTLSDSDLVYLEKQITTFRKQLSNIAGIKVLEYASGQGDFLKITIQSTSADSGFDLQTKLEEQGIFAELADPFNVLLVAPLLKDGQSYPFAEVIEKVSQAVSPVLLESEKHKFKYYHKKQLSRLELSYKEMKNRRKHKVPLSNAIGEIAAEMIVPYPPGIPLLFPGEIITGKDIEHVQWLLNKGTKFQGGESLKQGFIYVY